MTDYWNTQDLLARNDQAREQRDYDGYGRPKLMMETIANAYHPFDDSEEATDVTKAVRDITLNILTELDGENELNLEMIHNTAYTIAHTVYAVMTTRNWIKFQSDEIDTINQMET